MPNSVWDDLFPSEDSAPSRSVFDDDLWADDPIDPQRGLAMDEWNPEYQKTEGWNSLRDNPITKVISQGVLGAEAGIFKFGSATADLFDSVTNSDLWQKGAIPETSFALKPEFSEEDKIAQQLDINKAKQTSMLGVTSDILGDWSNTMSEAASNLSTKKDSGGGYMAEMGGNLDNILEGDVAGGLWESVKDTAGMVGDVGAGMAGMYAAGGPVKSLTGLGEMGSGMALQTYGDTYAELTKNDSDSRLMAVGVSAVDAAVEGIFEQIGWETALGKGAVAKWFEGKATDSVKKAMLARAVLTGPTEGTEEGFQGFTNILAKNLPNVDRDGWEATMKKIAIESYEQIPEQVFTGTAFGALFGPMVAGPQQSARRLAAKDIAARFGNLPSTADDKLAGAINQPPSEDAAKTALVDAVEKVSALAGGGDLTGTFPVATVDAEGNMVGEDAAVTPTVTDPVTLGTAGSDAGNEFVHAPQGYRVRVSNVSATGGVMLEKRSKTGQASSFYIGNDGKLIDAESINLADPKSLGLVWKPSSPSERSAAEEALREAAVMDLADPRRKEVLGRLPDIVSGNVVPAVAAATGKPKKKKSIKIDPDKLDTLVDPFETEARKLAIWASAVKSGEKAADDTIKDIVQQQEQDRAAIANLVNESDVDAAGERMMAAVEQAGQERQAQVESVSALAQQLAQMAQGAQPQWNGQQEESAVAIGEPMQLSTPEMVAAIQNKAAEVGVEVPESAVVDPLSFDWQGWVQEEVEMAKATARSGLKGPAEAIRDAVPMESTHPIAQLASAPPAPTSGLTKASQPQPPVAAQVPQSNASRYFALLKEAGHNLKAQISKDLLMVSRDTMISGFRTIVTTHADKVAAGKSQYITKDMMLEGLRKGVPAMSDKAWDSLRPVVNTHVNAIASLTDSIASAKDPSLKEMYRQGIADELVKLEDAMLLQNSKGILSFAPGALMPNIRAANRVSRSLAAPPKNVWSARNHSRTSPTVAGWIRVKATEQVDANNLLTPREKDTKINENEKYMASYLGAEKILPQIKQIIFSVWDSAPQKLVDRMGDAIRSGADHSMRELARQVAGHLESRGMYLDLVDEVMANDSSAAQFGYTLINVANGVMTPWTIENAANNLGVDRQEAKAAVAVMTAFSERWAMRNNKLPIEWWDRLADRVQLSEYSDSPLLGQAMSDTIKEVSDRRMVGFKNASNYAHGMMILFKTPWSVLNERNGSGTTKGGMSTILHESIHNLFMSGLMYEMLEPAERDAMESLAGEKLWSTDPKTLHEPLTISARAHEMMAVGFEKFLATNRAPNPRVRVAFEAMKDWFRRWINSWMGHTVKSHDTTQPNLPVNSEADVPMYGNPGSGGVYLNVGDIDITTPIAKMFYQLMNAEPDGSEIAYMPSGLSIATEKIIEAKTGVKAAGLFTKVPPASVMTLPVFPKERDVTADDLPGAEEAANIQWFHGTSSEIMDRTGLTSLLSRVGLVGTGVYLTDDPRIAESYRRAAMRRKNKTGYTFDPATDGGDVVAIRINPRKIINLEKPLPKDVLDIIENGMGSLKKKILGRIPQEIADAAAEFKRLYKELGDLANRLDEEAKVAKNEARNAPEYLAIKARYDAANNKYKSINEAIAEKSLAAPHDLNGVSTYDIASDPGVSNTLSKYRRAKEAAARDLMNAEQDIDKLISLKYAPYRNKEHLELGRRASEVRDFGGRDQVQKAMDIEHVFNNMFNPYTYNKATGINVIKDTADKLKALGFDTGHADPYQTADEFFRTLESDLRAAGYDAYTHIGGMVTNQETKHRVIVLLDPEGELQQAGGNQYPKIKHEAWTTRKVDPDVVEVGWNIHKGTIPTESEWRGVLGLTNDDDNGTHTQQTLMNMEEDRQNMGEISKAVKAQANSEMPSPVRTPVEEASASVQKALATEKPLDDEPIYESFMDRMMDMVMNGARSGYYSGKKVDPSDPEQVKGLLKNFIFKMNSWSHLAGTKGIVYATAKTAREALAVGTKQMIRATKFYESQLGNFMAPWERLFESLDPVTDEQIANVRNSTAGSAKEKQDAVDAYILERKNLNMGQKALMINNFHSLSKLADKIAEKRPQIWDTTINGWREIPGAKSHMQIQTEFSQMLETYFKNSPTAQSQYKDWYAFHEAAMRDLRAWMFSARQFELIENEKDADRQYDKAVAERERKIQEAQDASKTVPGAAYKVLDQNTYPEVKKPKVPRTTEEGNHWAESVKYLMEARYGKDVSMFKVAAAELTQWENHMVLDPLLASNMISEKMYSDMIAKGKSHIPMYRVREAITKSGMMNPRIDDNTYKVVDYLKHDISMKSEDPLNSMLLKAAAIQTLTYRQAAKNALGMRILQDIKWWDGENPESGVSIFVDKQEVTKEEYLELQKDPNNVLTMTQRFKKNAKGDRVESGHSFYHHVPYTGEDMKAQLKHVLNSEKAKAKYGNLTPEQRMSKYEQSVFAFFPEPGKAMYVLITDPALQKAFFYMNNPQAMYANSIRGRLERFIDEALPVDEQSDSAAKVAHYAARAVSSGYFGFNKVARGRMTSNPSFIFNMMPRDAPVSVARSRHGLRWRDIPAQFLQSTALLFPSMRELDPGKYTNAEDAADGIATFSGLAAADLDGALSTDVMSSIVHTRGDKMTKARTGDFISKAKLMWNDFSQFMAREGVSINPARMLSETKRGRNIGKNLLMIAATPLDIPKGVGQFIGTIFENATRLAERSLTMKEDMTQYPTLSHLYDPKRAIKGKLLAGFTGTEHRNKWEAAKAKLQADPNYDVPQDALPVQIDATERDYSMAHVTLNFPQKGYLTTSINQLSLFNNPMHQDFYTNMYALTKHRWMKRAVAYGLGQQYVPAADQPRLDQAAWRWIYKSFFYTTLPAAAMMLAYGTGDDDDSLEWQAQTFIEKMSYFWLPTNKIGLTKKPFRVATGLGLNKLIFADSLMAGWLAISGKDKRAINKWMNRMWENTPMGMAMAGYAAVASNTPGTVGETMGGQGTGYIGGAQELLTKTFPIAAPESINPLVELYMNKDSFRNKEIKMPEAIYNEDPTEIQREKYNLLVNSVTKKLDFLQLQPAQVQYLITRYFPGSAKWIPGMANKAMEMAAGVSESGMPQDVQASNSPVAGQSPGFLPRVFAKPSWGMGNEFVQDLLHTAREATKQKNSYDGMVESRRPGYLAEHPLIQTDIFYGRAGEDGYRSGGLKDVSAKIIAQNKAINEQLKLGKIDATQAMELQKAYTLMAMEAMRNIITQLGE